jgi:hypothetical protein
MENKTKTPSEAAVKKRAIVRALMYDMIVNTPTGRKRLTDLVDNVGVRSRVVYWNNVQVKRAGIQDWQTVKKVHDHGLVFNNGFEIRHVETKIFNYFKGVEKIEIRERQ